MPGATRAAKNDSLKVEPAGPEFSDICKMKVDDLDVDLAKVCDDSDETSIFSACNSPDDVEDSNASELGEYELSYLHTIYHSSEAMLDEDAILPEAIPPPSLGAISGLNIPSSGAHLSATPQPASSKKPLLSVSVEGRNAPPKGSHDSWDSESEEADERSASPVPTGPAVKSSPKTAINSRKRKASVAPVKVESSPKASRVKGPVDEDLKDVSENDYDSDRGSSPCPSNTPMLDGLEIRPEDDPLGLFSKDPATLTPEEQRILKKQRRLLKNRESAQLSRHRKKMHLNSLERQVEALKKEKAALASKVTDLQEENERLRKQMITMP